MGITCSAPAGQSTLECADHLEHNYGAHADLTDIIVSEEGLGWVKVRSQRPISCAHTTSVKPINCTFAAQDNAVQHVDIGALKDVSVHET